MRPLLALRSYLKLPLSVARVIIRWVGLLPYVISATVVPVGLMILGYMSMFDDFGGGKPRPGDEWRIIALVVPTALLVVLLIALPYIDELGRLEDEDRAKVRRGESWVHWRLPREEWSRFLEAEGGELRKEAQTTLLFGLAFAALLGLVFGLVSGPALGGSVFAMIGLIALAASGRELLLGSSLARARDVDIYVSGDFVIANDSHSRLDYSDRLGSGWSIASVRLVDTTPKLIELTCETFRSRTLGAIAGARYGAEGALAGAATSSAGPPIVVRVPVPSGNEADAWALLERFRQERGAKVL
jgi:hypothetical protein